MARGEAAEVLESSETAPDDKQKAINIKFTSNG
jgi:hypothetical protein